MTPTETPTPAGTHPGTPTNDANPTTLTILLAALGNGLSGCKCPVCRLSRPAPETASPDERTVARFQREAKAATEVSPDPSRPG